MTMGKMSCLGALLLLLLAGSADARRPVRHQCDKMRLKNGEGRATCGVSRSNRVEVTKIDVKVTTPHILCLFGADLSVEVGGVTHAFGRVWNGETRSSGRMSVVIPKGRSIDVKVRNNNLLCDADVETALTYREVDIEQKDCGQRNIGAGGEEAFCNIRRPYGVEVQYVELRGKKTGFFCFGNPSVTMRIGGTTRTLDVEDGRWKGETLSEQFAPGQTFHVRVKNNGWFCGAEVKTKVTYEEVVTPVPPTPVPPPTPAPTTTAPATNAPPTQAPPTDAPATSSPPTQAPPTDAPATSSPPTQAPPTDAPATSSPPTQAPPTDAPATSAPPTQAPPTDAPATSAPPTQAPPTDAPATSSPPTQAPPTDAPATSSPPTQAPPTDAPATDAPATQVPSTEAPETPVPTVTSGTWWPHWNSGSCKGSMDDKPAWETTVGSQEECCRMHFDWKFSKCMGIEKQGWWPNWKIGKCAFGGAPDWQETDETQGACCKKHFTWKYKKCMVTPAPPTPVPTTATPPTPIPTTAVPETLVPETAVPPTPEPTPTPPAVNAALSMIDESGNTISAVSGTIRDGFDGEYEANVDTSVTVVGTDCKITFTKMDVETSFQGYCRADYVRVMFGPDFKTGRRLCGDNLVEIQLRGESFRVDFSTNSINNAGGFELAFSCAGDPATPAPTPVPAPCVDKTKADGSPFHISAGSRFNCGYFESRTADRCARFGGDRYAVDGVTAQEACCVCGGGVQ